MSQPGAATSEVQMETGAEQVDSKHGRIGMPRNSTNAEYGRRWLCSRHKALSIYASRAYWASVMIHALLRATSLGAAILT